MQKKKKKKKKKKKTCPILKITELTCYPGLLDRPLDQAD